MDGDFMIIYENRLFDFNNEIEMGTDIHTEYLGKKLILVNVSKYDGPVTMQFLPYGGIQSVYHNQLIINTKSGFIVPQKIIYDGVTYSNYEFTSKFDDLVNQVLPC